MVVSQAKYVKKVKGRVSKGDCVCARVYVCLLDKDLVERSWYYRKARTFYLSFSHFGSSIAKELTPPTERCELCRRAWLRVSTGFTEVFIGSWPIATPLPFLFILTW